MFCRVLGSKKNPHDGFAYVQANMYKSDEAIEKLLTGKVDTSRNFTVTFTAEIYDRVVTLTQ